MPVSGTVARHDHRSDSDYYSQPGNLFRLLDAGAKKRLIHNFVDSLSATPKQIQELQVSHFLQGGSGLWRGRRRGLGIEYRRGDCEDQAGHRSGLIQWQRWSRKAGKIARLLCI